MTHVTDHCVTILGYSLFFLSKPLNTHENYAFNLSTRSISVISLLFSTMDHKRKGLFVFAQVLMPISNCVNVRMRIRLLGQCFHFVFLENLPTRCVLFLPVGPPLPRHPHLLPSIKVDCHYCTAHYRCFSRKGHRLSANMIQWSHHYFVEKA